MGDAFEQSDDDVEGAAVCEAAGRAGRDGSAFFQWHMSHDLYRINFYHCWHGLRFNLTLFINERLKYKPVTESSLELESQSVQHMFVYIFASLVYRFQNATFERSKLPLIYLRTIFNYDDIILDMLFLDTI